MIINIGIDVGQQSDPTAVAVTELVWRQRPDKMPAARFVEDHHVVRHLERLPLKTKYPQIAGRLIEIYEWLDQAVKTGTLKNQAGWLIPTDHARIKVYMDATGVGQPVADYLTEAGIKVNGVTFVHGEKRLVQKDPDTGALVIRLGKAHMVSRLQVLLQTHRIHLPNTDEAHALASELLSYEIKVNDRANEQMGAFKIGTHDDLVTALGLAVNDKPKMAGAVSSAPGNLATAVPEWAGGTPRLGTKTLPPMDPGVSLKPLRGLNNWGADGGNGLEQLGDRLADFGRFP